LLVAFGLRAARQPTAPTSILRLALLSSGPYALWAFVGQNLLKTRHMLPLLVGAALLVAFSVGAAERAGAGRLVGRLAGAFALCLLLLSFPLARQQGREASPAAQLVAHVTENFSPEGRFIFTGEEARLFEWYAPQYRAGRLPKGADLGAAAERLAAAGVQVFVTSASPGASEVSARLEPTARFSTDRLIRSHGHELVLYRFRSGSIAGRSAP
jgi:hypothetical protein